MINQFTIKIKLVLNTNFIFTKSGFSGVLNVVTASRSNTPSVGNLLCTSPKVAGISFTGRIFIPDFTLHLQFSLGFIFLKINNE